MTQMFQNVLTASFHGSIVILAVLLLRFLLKKTPKKYLCLLWLLAGIRLLMPFEIQSGLSLQPDVDSIRESAVAEAGEAVVSDAPLAVPEKTSPALADAIFLPDAPMEMMISGETAGEMPEVPAAADDPLVKLDEIAAHIWVAAAFGFLLYTIGAYIHLKMQVREAIRLRGNVWECDRIETAFILGFIRPQIYLPMGMSRKTRQYILAHEQTHLEKGDHWIKMIGFIALSLHWFNPLVWVAYWLLCKDIEMACDERVVQFMELEERKSYSAALLNCSTNRVHFAACPVAFGEVSVKNRVLSVLHYKKPSFWISLLGVIAIAFVAVCLVTSPTETAVPPETTESTEPEREVVQVSTVDALLAAIAPNRDIQLEAGTYLLSDASTYGKETGSDYYSWLEEGKGYTLVLTGVEDLTIRGSGSHVTLVETQPRYADVIAMENCHNVELADFTAGHTRGVGECSGGVIELRECGNIDLTRLGLYGCGVVGLLTRGGSEIRVTDCDVYECSSQAFSLHDTNGVTISGGQIYSIGAVNYGGYAYFGIDNCRDVVIEKCEISDSDLQCILSSGSSNVTIRNNLFVDNRIQAGAFSIGSNAVTLDGNKFENNSIRTWYGNSNGKLLDKAGNILTEGDMEQQYGTEPTEPQEPQLEIHVSTVDEFIAAIGPDKEIVLDAELYDLSTATGYGTSRGDYYFWEDIFDGPGLVIQDVTNMTIRSAGGDRDGCTISAVPRYADVLAFKACGNITLSGFTAGHTKEPGSCAGGVLEFRDCDAMTVDNCGLFGCGILGVQVDSGSDITVKNCEIYECSQGGIRMNSAKDVVLTNNTFRDIGGNEYMLFIGCENVVQDGNQIISSDGGSLSVSTPDQKAIRDLKDTVRGFADAYVAGDEEQLQSYLASTYTGGAETYPKITGIPSYYGFDVTIDHVMQLRKLGSYTYTVIIMDRKDSSTEEMASRPLSVTIIEENGKYKISDYSLAE